MTHEDQDLRALMRHAHHGDAPPPDFDAMLERARAEPRAKPVPSAAPALFAVAAMFLLGLGAALWWPAPDTPSSAGHVAAAPSPPAQALEFELEEALSWEAPTDFLLVSALGEDEDDDLGEFEDELPSLGEDNLDSLFPM